MPTIWETAMAKANKKIDAILGDTILMKRATDADFHEVEGFILEIDPPLGEAGIDTLLERQRIKLHRDFMPTRPASTDRFKHAGKFGAGVVMAPGVDIQTTGGDYWLFDIQKV